MAFWDTSAVFKLYVRERDSERVREVIRISVRPGQPIKNSVMMSQRESLPSSRSDEMFRMNL